VGLQGTVAVGAGLGHGCPISGLLQGRCWEVARGAAGGGVLGFLCFFFLTIFQMLQNPQMQPQQSSCIFNFKKHNWVTENND